MNGPEISKFWRKLLDFFSVFHYFYLPGKYFLSIFRSRGSFSLRNHPNPRLFETMEFPNRWPRNFKILAETLVFVLLFTPHFWGLYPLGVGEKMEIKFRKNPTKFHPNPNLFLLCLADFPIFMIFVGPTTRRAIYSETRLGPFPGLKFS